MQHIIHRSQQWQQPAPWKSGKLRWVVKGGGGLVPSIFGTTKACAFSANAQSRFVSFVLDGVLGPTGILHHTWLLYLCSSRSNARGEVRALEGLRVSTKSPSRMRDRGEGVVERNYREKCRIENNVINLPLRQISAFFYLSALPQYLIACEAPDWQNWLLNEEKRAHRGRNRPGVNKFIGKMSHILWGEMSCKATQPPWKMVKAATKHHIEK